MPIKKSFLEQKWYYRVAKVLFVWVPLLLVVAAIVLLIFVYMGGLPSESISYAVQGDASYIIWAAIGLALYFIILKIIWRGFLYIAFGGFEDDTKKKVIGVTRGTVQPVSPATRPAMAPSDKNEVFNLVCVLIVIACIYYAYFIYKPSPQPTPIKTTPGCVSTGCGTLWLCNGTYYSDGVQKRVNGCYSSSSRPSIIYSNWSGSCRQCP